MGHDALWELYYLAFFHLGWAPFLDYFSHGSSLSHHIPLQLGQATVDYGMYSLAKKLG